MGNDFWRTPRDVFDHWNTLYSFDVDVAANEHDHLCDIWIDKEMNGLTLDWCDLVSERDVSYSAAWCNPPYSRGGGPVEEWVRKFIVEASHGWTVCALLNADPSTRWWDLIWDRDKSIWRQRAWKDDDGRDRRVDIAGYFLRPRVRHRLPEEGQPGYEEGKNEGSPKFGSVIVIFSGG